MTDDIYPSGLGAHPCLREIHAAVLKARASNYVRNGKHLRDMTREELIEEIGRLLTERRT